MSEPARRLATPDDLLALPDHVVGEIVGGELHVHPRPAARHGMAASALGGELCPPFTRGRGGPGGWILLDEPELRLEADVVVPDLAGWRRERMPELPDVAFFELAPDWVCEVLSPSTARFDRHEKRAIYAHAGVPWIWWVDPASELLEVLELDGDSYRVQATHAGDVRARAEPFAAVEIELGALWAR
ncbi:MAG TPA: Uma2 family endonuclease [Polyangiaceae bacterium]|nr:Uma2 family endonuclease [Polyangiaceae bacterium]